MHSGMTTPREEQHEQGRMDRDRKYRIHGDAMLCSLDVPRMSAGDLTPKKIADMRERMDESMWDDRWCARSVCEDAISAIEASLAREDDLRHQLEERKSPDMVTVPREEREILDAFLSEWVLLQWAEDPRGDGDPAPHRKRIDELFERLDALRSAQATVQKAER